MKSKTTQTERIRRAMKVHPDLSPKQIANIVGVKPRAVHMVKYLDKKRGTQQPDVANNTPKQVALQKRGTWSPTTPRPEWAKPNLPASEALNAKIEEIKASNPNHGKPLALWEIVVICLAVAFVVNLGMRLVGVN